MRGTTGSAPPPRPPSCGVGGLQALSPWLPPSALLASLKSLRNLFSFSDRDGNMYLLNKLNKVPKPQSSSKVKKENPCEASAQRLRATATIPACLLLDFFWCVVFKHSGSHCTSNLVSFYHYHWRILPCDHKPHTCVIVPPGNSQLRFPLL